MNGDGLKGDMGDLYPSLKELIKSTRESEDDMESLYQDVDDN